MTPEQKFDAITTEADKLGSVIGKNFHKDDPIRQYMLFRLGRIMAIAATLAGMTPTCLIRKAEIAQDMALQAAATLAIPGEKRS